MSPSDPAMVADTRTRSVVPVGELRQHGKWAGMLTPPLPAKENSQSATTSGEPSVRIEETRETADDSVVPNPEHDGTVAGMRLPVGV